MPKINLLNTSNRNNSNYSNNLDKNNNIIYLNSKITILENKLNQLQFKFDVLLNNIIDSSLNNLSTTIPNFTDISDTVLRNLL